MTGEPPALDARNLTVQFGDAVIVDRFDVVCHPGTLTVITGPNGAGKTTLLNALNGMCRLRTGNVILGGREISHPWTPDRAFRFGVRRTFQVPRNWPSLDVLENVGIVSDREIDSLTDGLHQSLPGVAPGRSPATLSLGQRRMLEMLRLLNSRGRCTLALLDEPLSGLDGTNAAQVFDIVAGLRRSRSAVLLVDHEPDNWPDRDAILHLDVPLGRGGHS